MTGWSHSWLVLIGGLSRDSARANLRTRCAPERNHLHDLSCNESTVDQWIPFVLRKTLFDFIKSCGSQIRLKFSEVALIGLLYSPK